MNEKCYKRILTDNGDAFDFRDGADEDAEYEYDANGNMTVDLNRGIKEIEYDVSNRPLSVTFSTRPAEQRTKYLRDASGRKLRTTYQTSRFLSLGPDDLWHVDTLELNPGIWDHIGGLRPLSSPGFGDAVGSWNGDKVQPAENMLWNTDFTRDYCGDIIYKDGEIERILTDNGYAVPDSAGGYDYYYYVKDYQGNIRAVLDEEDNVMESNGYYPYGMPYADNYFSVQPYEYGGKELDRANGLDMYDFEARHYDPVVPHFITMDELCEKYPSISPYAYCAGNPIRYVDPDGKEFNVATRDISYQTKFRMVIDMLRYLDANTKYTDIADNMEYLYQIEKVINVVPTNGESKFVPKAMTIYLNLDNAVVLDNGTIVSPLVVSNHEFKHTRTQIETPQKYGENIKAKDPYYQNKEEKEAIEMETKTAIANGEIKDGEVTRTNHNIKGLVPVSDPTSNRPTDEELKRFLNLTK